jgi:hypothetical protein
MSGRVAARPPNATDAAPKARGIGGPNIGRPPGFAGDVATVDLRSPRARLMDSQVVRLEWIPKKEGLWAPGSEPTKPERTKPEPATLEPVKPSPAALPLSPEEIAILIKRGDDFLKYGDVASARLSLRRAAGAGSAQAALALGVTFDPAFLREQGILGFAPDVPQARAWYERAVELGSSDAARRLERLTRPR